MKGRRVAVTYNISSVHLPIQWFSPRHDVWVRAGAYVSGVALEFLIVWSPGPQIRDLEESCQTQGRDVSTPSARSPSKSYKPPILYSLSCSTSILGNAPAASIARAIFIGISRHLTFQEPEAKGNPLLLCDAPDVGYQGSVFTLEGSKLEAGFTVLVIEEVCDGAREVRSS
jgi:hypothetical protein